MRAIDLIDEVRRRMALSQDAVEDDEIRSLVLREVVPLIDQGTSERIVRDVVYRLEASRRFRYHIHFHPKGKEVAGCKYCEARKQEKRTDAAPEVR